VKLIINMACLFVSGALIGWNGAMIINKKRHQESVAAMKKSSDLMDRASV